MPLATGARLLLPVRQYYVQTDSRVPGQAPRMCFSSTCAMAVKYLQPAALRGPNADDTYLHTVSRYGDTTSPQAQISACADYGVLARFSTSGDRALLERELRSGYPLATGFLHHGPSSAPRGGGHWILSVGLTPGSACSMIPTASSTPSTAATCASAPAARAWPTAGATGCRAGRWRGRAAAGA